MNRSRATLDELVYALIAERRAARDRGQVAGKDGDLLDLLMDAVDEDNGATLSDEELCDDVMTNFLAGHETTSNLLSADRWNRATFQGKASQHDPRLEGDAMQRVLRRRLRRRRRRRLRRVRRHRWRGVVVLRLGHRHRAFRRRASSFCFIAAGSGASLLPENSSRVARS
jgi:hypothetical protein